MTGDQGGLLIENDSILLLIRFVVVCGNSVWYLLAGRLAMRECEQVE